jgi:RNA polymerase sigma factor (sigma-70 family)
MSGLQWLEENPRAVRWLLRKYPSHMHDDLWGVCVDRAEAIMATWDGTKGATMGYHMVKNLRWYMWKWVRRRQRDAERHPENSERVGSTYVAPDTLEHSDEVRSVMDRLTPYERHIVVLHAVDGMSFEQVAELVHSSKNTVRLQYLAAVEKARCR